MGLNIQSVLSTRNLMGLVTTVKPGLPIDMFPPGLIDPTPRRVDGDSGTYFRVQGTRKTARMAMYGSPSRRRKMSGVQEIPVKLASYSENVGIKAQTLLNIEDPDGNKQRLGEWEVARQVKEINQIAENTRRAHAICCFALGGIYWDEDGNLLPSSSGAAVSIDYGIPAGNKDQLDIDGNGDTITDWSNASTSIVEEAKNVKTKARKANGYVPEIALYGANIMDYFLKNTELQGMIIRNPAWQQSFANGEIPDNFLGFDWYPAYQSFFEDQDDAVQTVFGDDNITFVPRPDGTWYELLEGTTPVPRNLNMTSDLSSAVANIDLAQGRYAYAKVIDDPVQGEMIYGDCFLYTLNVPGAVYIATVA